MGEPPRARAVTVNVMSSKAALRRFGKELMAAITPEDRASQSTDIYGNGR